MITFKNVLVGKNIQMSWFHKGSKSEAGENVVFGVI